VPDMHGRNISQEEVEARKLGELDVLGVATESARVCKNAGICVKTSSHCVYYTICITGKICGDLCLWLGHGLRVGW